MGCSLLNLLTCVVFYFSFTSESTGALLFDRRRNTAVIDRGLKASDLLQVSSVVSLADRHITPTVASREEERQYTIVAQRDIDSDYKKPAVQASLKTAIAGFVGGICFTMLAASAMGLLGLGGMGQFETAEDIPPAFFRGQKDISAVVVKITDGDTFRMRHVTHLRADPTFTGKLTEHTIAVRLAAVDTPETAKLGAQGQPLAAEAKEFARTHLLGQRVKVQLLSRDQYGRVVGLVRYRQPGWLIGSSQRDLSEQLLSQGLAVVYRQGGAQYGAQGQQFWERLEQRAVDRRLGVWAQGRDGASLPSDYKKAAKQKQQQKKQKKQSAFSSI